jgi:NADPH2:quinone reductase
VRALVFDPAAPAGLRLGDTQDPVPGLSQALVRVAATSLNFADVAFLHDRKAPGAVPGFDAAGVVAAAAADGSGPPAGAPVVTFGWSGGWAELRAVETTEIAVLPDGVAALGAAEVVIGLDDVTQPVFAALDNVGGRTLSQAYELLEPGGCVQSVGMASLEPTLIDFEQARMRGGGRIEAFTVGDHFGPDLAYLVGLLAAGELDPQVGWRGPWHRAADAAAALMAREVRGKAVLDVSS